MRKITFILSLCLLGITDIQAENSSHGNHAHMSKYAGQEKREIKSLSPDDIAELRRGGGWGLAKSAELNGVPGPIHLLEMKEEIQLTAPQISAVTEVYEAMKAEAVKLGEKYIALEKALENKFQQRDINETTLRTSLDAIAEVRKELRYAHLVAHLKTPEILTAEQIDQYNTLRGYNSSDDPCLNIPKGHNPAMWKKHHGCK